MPLIVQISRVVENCKLLRPQPFSRTFWRLVSATHRQQSIHRHHPVSHGPFTLLESSQ